MSSLADSQLSEWYQLQVFVCAADTGIYQENGPLLICISDCEILLLFSEFVSLYQ